MRDDDYAYVAAQSYAAALRDAVEAVENVPYITDERWADTAPITVAEYRKHVLSAIEQTHP